MRAILSGVSTGLSGMPRADVGCPRCGAASSGVSSSSPLQSSSRRVPALRSSWEKWRGSAISPPRGPTAPTHLRCQAMVQRLRSWATWRPRTSASSSAQRRDSLNGSPPWPLSSSGSRSTCSSPLGLRQAAAARDTTRTMPIVMIAVNYDPMAQGYIDGLARPGSPADLVQFPRPARSGRACARRAVPA